MTRGRKPIKSLEEAEKAARSFGYRWLANPDPDLPYDAFLFSRRAAIVMKVRSVKNKPDPDQLIDDLFPEDLDDLRRIPVPPHVIREFWLRTRSVRGFRIFIVLPEGIAEIGFNASIGYYNPTHEKAIRKRLPDKKTSTR